MENKMNLTFQDRGGNVLPMINQMLAGVRFHELSLEDFEGYLITAEEYNADGTPKKVSYSYGFDSLELAFETAEGKEAGKRYQLTAEVVPSGTEADSLHRNWMKRYPERRVCSITQIAYENAQKNVLLVLYRLSE